MGTGQDGAKIRSVWDGFYAPEGLGGSAGGFNPWNRHPAMTRPEWAPSRALYNTHIDVVI